MKLSISELAAALLAAAGVAAAAPELSRLSRRALAQSDPHYPSPWMDPQADGWTDAYSKAASFVSQLTLLEKINLTTGVGWEGERCVGNTGSIPRLGMRGLCLQDGPVGVRFTDDNSVFPSGQLTAATFDRGLMYSRAQAIAEEHRAKGVDVVLAPVAGPLGRHPDGGRNWEGFSPDPYLTGVAMAQSVMGIQDAGMVACAKHLIGNEQEHFRQPGTTDAISSNIDDRTIHELYLWPFADAVRAGVGSVMCSYNQVNNSYACQNSKLLNGLLKAELGFQGFVVSDWAAQRTGAASAAAGLDMTMPGDQDFDSASSFFGASLTQAVLNGTIPAWRIDDMAMRVMAAFFKVGKTVASMADINFSSWTADTYGPVHAFAADGYQVVNQHVDVRAGRAHADLIRDIASRGAVLLKNTAGALPLSQPGSLVVIGEDAGPSPAGPNGCVDRGCDSGTLGIGWGSGTANFPYLVTPDAALQMQALNDGSMYQSVLSNWRWDAVEPLVQQPNVTALVFVNADSGEGYLVVDGNAGDRKNLTLWNGGEALIRNVSAICANTIVVMHTTGPVLVADWHASPNVTAIVWAGAPGQESGDAITDVLYGRVNPAGRTPFTWGPTPESYGVRLVTTLNNGATGAPQSDFSDGVFIDYRHFDRVSAQAAASNATSAPQPVWEFGFGLSYTTFEYSNLEVDTASHGGYEPTAGETAAAPTFGHIDTNQSAYGFPADIRPITAFIYPYLNETSGGGSPNSSASGPSFLPAGASSGAPQVRLPSSGVPGGNPSLWDVLYTVRATVTNSGTVAGEEVAQLYVGLGDGTGGGGDPVRMLRGFDRLSIAPGNSATFEADLARRDVSRWDTVGQDWVEVPAQQITVWVGGSSRRLPLSALLG